jgi:3'-phosphoadenosine 5'-phosphosulfate sulfotransferase (PAPS reductase)/FAD synthetase
MLQVLEYKPPWFGKMRKVRGGTIMEYWELKQKQSLPLEMKVIMSKQRIKEWYEHWRGDVYVAFSGGKDSTVLLDLVRSMYPEVHGMFVDTGLEYPEIKDFVKEHGDIDIRRPAMPFHKVIEKYGYPVVSKSVSKAISRFRGTTRTDQKIYRLHGGKDGKAGTIPKKYQYLINAPFKISDMCCQIMKKTPAHKYDTETGCKVMTGEMAKDSQARLKRVLKTGCNAFDLSHPKSMPLSVWSEQDIWLYIHKRNIPYSKIYDMGEKRTGCMFCMFGLQAEGCPNRFQRMALSHPKQYRLCKENMKMDKVLSYMHIPYKAVTPTKPLESYSSADTGSGEQ